MDVTLEDEEQASTLVTDPAGLVDLNFLEEIHDDFGTELLLELKSNLEVETKEAFDDLERYAEAGDSAACAATLHFLRGAAINLGLVCFAEICQRLETASRAGDVPSCAARAALPSILTGSLESFETRLSMLPA